MITQVNAIMLFLVIHYVADYVCQHPWMANNKSKRFKPLLVHILVYTSIMGVTAFFIFGYSAVLVAFILSNGFAHMLTDYNTSKISSRLYEQKKYWRFFNILGIDQLAHQLVLIYTLTMFY